MTLDVFVWIKQKTYGIKTNVPDLGFSKTYFHYAAHWNVVSEIDFFKMCIRTGKNLVEALQKYGSVFWSSLFNAPTSELPISHRNSLLIGDLQMTYD